MHNDMKHIQVFRYLFLVYSLLWVVSCDPEKAKDNGDDPEPVVTEKPSEEVSKATTFASDVLEVYYLWNKEIEKSIPRLDPDTCFSPKAVVKEIRYNENGKQVDRWTALTDDMESMMNSVQSLGVTYGYELQIGRITNQEGVYFLLVSLVYANSPAEKAGLKRGDIIITIDGSKITSSNYSKAFSSTSITVGVTGLRKDEASGSYYIDSDATSVQMNAVDMYLDPIVLSKTFDVAGKKIGYLFYNSFDLNSASALPPVFKKFKEEGISELIVDLRYNGGGYAFTEKVLGSMIAPVANVDAGDIFQTEVYNSLLSDAWKKQGYDTNTYFSTTHEYGSGSSRISIDLSDVNPGVSKVYYIVTGSSASASEGLIVGLGPYQSQVLIGEQTYGKYCAGFLLSPEDVYDSRYDYSLIKNWGIYVMVSKFADKNGKNASLPDGLPVDVASEDNPLDGHQLGDEEETMLKAALEAAGKVYTRSSVKDAPQAGEFQTRLVDHGAPRGMLIKSAPHSVEK